MNRRDLTRSKNYSPKGFSSAWTMSICGLKRRHRVSDRDRRCEKATDRSVRVPSEADRTVQRIGRCGQNTVRAHWLMVKLTSFDEPLVAVPFFDCTRA